MRYQVASAAPVRPAAMSLLVWALMAVPAAHTREKKPGKPHRPPQESARKAAPARKAALATAASLSALASQTTRDGEAEAALIEVYRRIGQGRLREALAQSDVLVKTHPNFQLAQLVHGDLLSAHRAPITALGDVPADAARKGAAVLADLREESMMRLKALREKPPADTVPSQFLQLAPSIRHAVAVDASRSRLYLFENSASGTRLVADYYVSVGKLGTDKLNEGDQRTPLGIYFITSHLNPGQLKDFYGAGALPINYPNPLDNRRGKTGSGIWLHGTPPDQFARAPKSSDGCIVLANPDLQRLVSTVAVRSTPVVIAQQLQWVKPQALSQERRAFDSALETWRAARSEQDLPRLLSHYAADFSSQGKSLTEWSGTLSREMLRQNGRPVQLRDVSTLQWRDSTDTMIVMFGELAEGSQTLRTRRQYWVRQGTQWKIFNEGVIG